MNVTTGNECGQPQKCGNAVCVEVRDDKGRLVNVDAYEAFHGVVADLADASSVSSAVHCVEESERIRRGQGVLGHHPSVLALAWLRRSLAHSVGIDHPLHKELSVVLNGSVHPSAGNF